MTTSASIPTPAGALPALVTGLCDDAAVFPPGLAPLPDAVRAYVARTGEWYAALAGPLVIAAAALPRLAQLIPAGAAPLPLAVTLPQGPAGIPGVLGVLAGAARAKVDLRVLEVAVPAGMSAAQLLDEVGTALDGVPTAPDVVVEIPRDVRGTALLAGLPAGYRAKFRTGGVRAELYPGEAELAESMAAAVEAGVPFKATAGLHHALRNTDPETSFEQHGFLNLLLATDALLRGTGEEHALLAERDGAVVAERVTALDADQVAATRAAFTSFGTCSILDPLEELVALGIVQTPVESLIEAVQAGSGRS